MAQESGNNGRRVACAAEVLTTTLQIPACQLAWARSILETGFPVEGYEADAVIAAWPAGFEDCVETILFLRNSTDGPRVEVVLYDRESEVQRLSSDRRALEGEYAFTGYKLSVRARS